MDNSREVLFLVSKVGTAQAAITAARAGFSGNLLALRIGKVGGHGWFLGWQRGVVLW